MSRIYLDHAATTPMRPEARAAVADAMARWANPSSPHAEGRAARAALEEARARVKKALGWAGELIFTSGASEALAIALGRAKATRWLVSAVEHDAVFRAAPDADVLPLVGGEPDLDRLEAYLACGAAPIVAIQSINSETGTMLLPGPRSPATEMVRAAGGAVLSDCAQSAGKQPLPDADLIVVSAHKLGGPPGIGALLVRDLALLEPSGGQERGYRSGTENLPGVLGFAAALEADADEGWATDAAQGSAFGEALRDAGELVAPGTQCSHIFAVAMPRVRATAQLVQLDALGFAVSAGSACSSGALKRSRALAGFGVADELADRTIRVSIGWSTTAAELDAFLHAWRGIAKGARARAA